MHDIKYHLYFVDYRLGAQTGLQLIQESIEKNCEEPFILLTGIGNHAIDLMAMQSGAVDYLVKGELNKEKLERCIRYSLERASAIKALKTNERKFRNIFERSKDMIFIADENLCFIEMNNASIALLGYERSVLLSKSLYHFLANTDTVFIKKQLSLLGEVSDKEVAIITNNDEKRYCLLTISRETDIKGDVYIQGMLHDISLLKKTEKDTLMLEKLNVAGRLVRIMAHEVRNPLSNIMLSSDQLEQVVDNPEAKTCLDIINRNSKRIGNLITELLNSSRRDPVSVEKKSLQTILNETLEAAVDRIKLRNIQLQRNYLTEPAWVMADNEKLKIAFLNIIINAIEAMPLQEGKLTVFIKKKDQQYTVSIEDNGCGISDEDISQVFEPYFTSKNNGIGLGLAATLNIIQSHKARVEVESEMGKYTTFIITFPLGI